MRAVRPARPVCFPLPRMAGWRNLQIQENVGRERSSEPRILQEVSWEVTPMQITVALRGRTRLAALLRDLEQEAGQREQGQRCDQRNRRTWRQLIVGMLVARSTRLVALGRVMAPQRRGGRVEKGGGGGAQ